MSSNLNAVPKRPYSIKLLFTLLCYIMNSSLNILEIFANWYDFTNLDLYSAMNRNLNAILTLSIISYLIDIAIPKKYQELSTRIPWCAIIGTILIIIVHFIPNTSIIHGSYISIVRSLPFFIGLGLITSWIIVESVLSTQSHCDKNSYIFSHLGISGISCMIIIAFITFITAYCHIPKFLDVFFTTGRFYEYVFWGGYHVICHVMIAMTIMISCIITGLSNKLIKFMFYAHILIIIPIPLMYVFKDFGDNNLTVLLSNYSNCITLLLPSAYCIITLYSRINNPYKYVILLGCVILISALLVRLYNNFDSLEYIVGYETIVSISSVIALLYILLNNTHQYQKISLNISLILYCILFLEYVYLLCFVANNHGADFIEEYFIISKTTSNCLQIGITCYIIRNLINNTTTITDQ